MPGDIPLYLKASNIRRLKLKNRFIAVLLASVLLIIVAATGCTSYATSEQVAALQNQVNSLSNSLNSTQQQLSSTQQQLSSTQQQLNTAQQSLSQAQTKLQQQSTYTTSAQPVYQPSVVYQTYPYGYQGYSYYGYRSYPYGYQGYPYYGYRYYPYGY